MKALKMLVVALFTTALAACGSLDIYGSGSRDRGASYSNAEVLGVGGAALGGALVRSNPLAGAAAGGLAGYYTGRSMDKREHHDRMVQAQIRAEQGWTECRAEIQRTYNRDGTVKEVLVNDENCKSGKSTPYYRDGFNK